MAENNVFSMKMGTLKKLKCLMCSIHVDFTTDEVQSSIFHRRILKCRELIFTNPQILSGPVEGYNSERNIFVVFLDKEEEESKVKEEINNLDLHAMKEYNVTPDILNTVIKYTLKARLAPLWNVVEYYFVRGENFLLEESPADAVEVDLAFKGNVVTLKLSCYKFTLNRINDEEYLKNSSQDQSAFVLPKMTQCRILGVNEKMPTIRFSNFAKLADHWKQLYGYLIPSMAENMSFYEVDFPQVNDSDIFTYPGLCLSSGISIYDPSSTEKDQMVKNFINDFNERFPAIFRR